jgi:hypothetical protein
MDSGSRLINWRFGLKQFQMVVALFAFASSSAASQAPANAHKSAFGTGWECNRGFAQSGDQCIQVQIPPNAELDVFGHGWQCRRGYAQTGDACIQVRIPGNAHLDVFGHGWECDRGFRQQANGCVSVLVPEHAHLDVFGHGWECNSNYKQQGSGCIVMSPQESQEAQQRQRELIQRFAVQQRALDSVDWSNCNSELDRLRRSARDASDLASAVESAKNSYDSCRGDRSNDCSSERSHYESERSNFAGELDTVMSRYKSALSSCGR